MADLKIDEFVKKFNAKLEALAEDLMTLSVVTLSTDQQVKPLKDDKGRASWDVTPPESLTLIGRTEIQLDGDINTIIPLKEDKTLNETLFAVHKDMVSVAIKQRSELFKDVVEVVK